MGTGDRAKSIDAVVDVVDGEVPAFLATKYRPEQVRFAFTRALFEYLTSTVEPTALLTSARTERQKRNRAFAAEFLAPEAFLRERLPGEYVGLEEIEEVADQLGVSTLVVQHQIQNHGVATVMEY